MDTAWLIAEPEPFEDYDLGPLKTGKEAEVFLVERVAADGRSCLLAHKRYRPRAVTFKGELQALGFQRAANFVNDQTYRDGLTIKNARDRRAVAKKTRHGREVLRGNWPANEFAMLTKMTGAGVTAPFPVAQTEDGVLMQYVGNHEMAAPRLGTAGLTRAELRRAAELLVDNLVCMVEVGVVHADLSVYNLLWWDERLWVIDVPQAVDISTNDQALDFLHRDLSNVGSWLHSRRIDFDVEDLFARLVAIAIGS